MSNGRNLNFSVSAVVDINSCTDVETVPVQIDVKDFLCDGFEIELEEVDMLCHISVIDLDLYTAVAQRAAHCLQQIALPGCW